MSRPRLIKDYFKRPVSAQKDPPVPIQPSSSPLSDPPSDLPSNFASSQQLPEPIPTTSQANGSVLQGAGSPRPATTRDYTSFQRSSSLNASFSSSQRVVKNGKEIVIDSDADSVDSDESLENVDDLLKRFLGSASPSASKKAPDSDSVKPDTASTLPSRKGNFFGTTNAKRHTAQKQYKFSIESLVRSAVDDDEIESNVAKAKALSKLQNETTQTSANSSESQSKGNASHLREDVLASALASGEQEPDFQRLLNAVKRTEALEKVKSWHFLREDFEPPSAPEFPRDSILPSSREAFLREAFTRERAFFSGIVDFTLSRGLLPDEILIWIFQSVPLEPRDELRYAYCRALKSIQRERVEFLLAPEDIDQIFQSLGCYQTALAAEDPVIPVLTYHQGELSRNWSYLLSTLQMLRDIADCLRPDTKLRTLHYLFRLVLDTNVLDSDMVIASLEATLDYLLQSIPSQEFEAVIQPIGKTLCKTLKDVTFQGLLLTHILPSSREIASFRCRLAMAFLTKDEMALENLREEQVIPLNAILDYLRSTRLDSQLQKARLSNDYDYTEVKAIAILLNIVIDTGRSTLDFADKAAERQFNATVDSLAEQVKRIFSAMEDSGASHLKRTEAKQSLEALQYRILYSVRTKQRIKSMFGHTSPRTQTIVRFAVPAKKPNPDVEPLDQSTHEE